MLFRELSISSLKFHSYLPTPIDPSILYAETLCRCLIREDVDRSQVDRMLKCGLFGNENDFNMEN